MKMPEHSQTATVYPWVNLVCFAAAGGIAFLAYLLDGGPGMGTAWLLMLFNGGILAALYRWTEGTWPSGKSRTLAQYNVIIWDTGLLYLAHKLIGEFVSPSYASLTLIAFTVLLFISHWFLPDPLVTAKPSDETPSKAA